MRRALIDGMLLMAGATMAGRLAAAPPPPPPAFVDELAQLLVLTPMAASFDRYVAAFAGDVAVRENGNPVVTGKDAWLSGERHKLGKVDRVVLTYAESTDAVLVVERIDDRSDLSPNPAVLFDPRYVTRATRYAVGPDHLIHAIDIVQTDGFPRRP